MSTNTKLKTLIQALIDEVNEVKGVRDTKGSPDNWWKLIDWKEPEMRTAFDALSENTRKLIIDEGLCPDCPEKKFPEVPKDEGTLGSEPEMKVPCTELLKKEHPDWSEEKIAEFCEEAESIDEWDKEIDEIIGKDAQLTYKAKKGHPDDDYAYIDPDCKKVDGQTPQSCRHLLIHDPAHVKAALAALGGARSGKVPPYADKTKPKVCAAAKKFKIESPFCGGGEKKKDEAKPRKDENKLDPYAVLERANKVFK